jgi:hypothetical protein
MSSGQRKVLGGDSAMSSQKKEINLKTKKQNKYC